MGKKKSRKEDRRQNAEGRRGEVRREDKTRGQDEKA